MCAEVRFCALCSRDTMHGPVGCVACEHRRAGDVDRSAAKGIADWFASDHSERIAENRRLERERAY